MIETFRNYKTIFTSKVHHPWDNNIDVNARKSHRDNMGVTPAFMAAKSGSFEIFRSLAAMGASIEGQKCSQGNQLLEPIHIASKNGHQAIVNLILAKTPDQRSLCNEPIESTGSRPLHLAAYGGHLSLCQDLLNFGALFTSQNHYGDTFLHIAVRHDHQYFV